MANTQRAEKQLSGPRNVDKAEFSRRLWKLMADRGWNQSELARQSGLARDVISTYMRRHSLPTPTNMQKLADALGVPIEHLAPPAATAVHARSPTVEMRQLPAAGRVWLAINAEMDFDLAVEVLGLLRTRGVVSNAA